MRNRLKFIFLFFIAFSFIDVSFAEPTCCYGKNGITPSPDGCSEGQFEIGIPVGVGSSFECSDYYESEKSSCAYEGQKYCDFMDYPVYDIQEVLDFITTQTSVNIEDVCVIDTFSGCSGDLNPPSDDASTGENDDGADSDYSSGGSDDFDLDDDVLDEERAEEVSRECRSLGGPFNIFIDKNTCESYEDVNGDNPCIYNPYLAGNIGAFSEGFLNNLESACVAKSEIKTCFDYKTQENCEDNDLSYRSSALIDCGWVPNMQILDSNLNFNVESGICMPDYVNDNKSFNIYNYVDRGNLLENPSFEKGHIGWLGDFDLRIRDASYEGKKYAKLRSGEKISQEVEFLDDVGSYEILFFIETNRSFNDNDMINLKIIPLEGDGRSVDTNIMLSQFNSSEGFFKKYSYVNQYNVPDEVEGVEFSLMSNVDVGIDAIYFGLEDSDSVTTTQNKFSSLSVIASSASYCSLCSDIENLNFCTEEKSDLLGDCSYLVENVSVGYGSNLTNYTGKEENKFVVGGSDNFENQSIANSFLFCEMYTIEDQCISEDNYVNSKYSKMHPRSDGNLCSWNDEYGCFKDSNSDGGPDTLRKFSPDGNLDRIYFNFMESEIDGFSSFFNNYTFESTDEYLSDFVFGCDVVPPNLYVNFVARNTSLGNVYVSDEFPDQILGNVLVNLEYYDNYYESCSRYDIPRRLYLDYSVNGNSAFHFSDGSSVSISDRKISEFFINKSSGESLLREGPNQINMTVKDQSGNFGKTFSYDLNVDLSAPSIVLDEDKMAGSENMYGPFGPNLNLSFIIEDTYTEVAGCDFELSLESGDSEGVEFTSSGNFFDYTTNLTDRNFEFDMPVNSTSQNGNWFKLIVSCSDVFEQVNASEFHILLDYNASFVVLDPMDLGGIDNPWDKDFGFLNGRVDFSAVSLDVDISSCEFLFRDTDGDGFLNVEDGTGEFPISGYGEVDIFKNITGELWFHSDSRKNISVLCEDNVGNEKEYELIYYYDATEPELLDFEMINDVGSSEKYLLEIGGKYYARRLGVSQNVLNNLFNLSIDGTNSWISTNSQDYNITLLVNETTGEYVGVNPSYVDFDIENDTFIGNVLLRGIEDLEIGGNLETGESGLFYRNYSIEYKDKANNSNVGSFGYYVDLSNPRYEFAGDVFEHPDQDGKLYSEVSNPEFRISFNSPSYRLYGCRVDVDWRGRQSSIVEEDLNSFVFDLSFIEGFDLSLYDGVELTFECIDIYNHSLGEQTYNLYYDNVSPVIDDMYFESGNSFYRLNHEGVNIEDIVDNLVFEFANTGDDYYNCTYGFEELDEFSACSDDLSGFEYGVSGQGLSFVEGPLNLLTSDTSDFMCYRPSHIRSELGFARDTGDDLVTSGRVYAKCSDRVGLESEVYELDYEVIYVSGGDFVDLEISYSDNKAYVRARSLMRFDNVGLYFGSDGLDEDLIVSLQGSDALENGLYVYTGVVDFSAGEWDTEMSPYDVWAIGFVSDNVWDRVSSELIVDLDAPSIDLRIPDASESGTLYFTEFQVLFDIVDEGDSGIEEVELYVDDTLIYSANESVFDLEYINDVDMSKNYFSFDRRSYFGNVVFDSAQQGNNYTFKVIAKDNFGNVNESEYEVEVLDGVGIRLLDSEDSMVDYDGFSWITKADSPTIGFETSKSVVSCSVYPFYDDSFEDLSLKSENIFMAGTENNEFFFDLSEIGFSYENANDTDLSIYLSCFNGSMNFNYTRSLIQINTLPDYVFKSQDGFIVNNDPYEIGFDVVSVGPYKYIDCQYILDGTSYDLGNYATHFSGVIDFSEKVSGSYDVVLECEDYLGTKGPKKSYMFDVRKNEPTSVDSVVLKKGNLEYKSENTAFYVNSKEDLDLNFLTNKKDVDCNYQLSNYGGGVFQSIVDFIKNLFVDNRINIPSDGGYLYSASGLSIAEGGPNELRIFCDGMSDPVVYSIYYESGEEFDFGLERY